MPVALAIAAGGAFLGSQLFKQPKTDSVATNPTPDASQTVGDKTANQTSNANNLGRAALIATSPSGVMGTDPTGRRKLVGND